MLLFTFLSPVIGLLSLSEVIPLVVFVAYIIFYAAYYIVTLVAGISSIQDYNAG